MATVVIAGASGFVGRAVAKELGKRFEVIGLSRHPRAPSAGSGIASFREGDLFSRSDAETALKGATYAIFLVHSMEQTATFTQGTFDELDMLAADNFARAAASAGVKQIIYLGGLAPDRTPHLSAHLASRLEVERVLEAAGVPVTVLRAGLVVGAHGSSFEMMNRLVDRLPVMILPSWTDTPTQPIALADVVRVVAHVIGREEAYGQTFDIGGPEVMSYRSMLERLARVKGKALRNLPVPFFTPRLSTLWVSLVTGAPRELVKPLVQSLACPMVAHDLRLQESLPAPPPICFEDAARAALADTKEGDDVEPAFPSALPSRRHDVRSIQRLPLPDGRDAAWLAERYLEWLPHTMRPFLHVVTEGTSAIRFRVPGGKVDLLRLERLPRAHEENRVVFRVVDGLLFRQGSPRARLEFRAFPTQRSALVAVHDFEPRLPFGLYKVTQAALHAFLMRAFGRYLEKHMKDPVTRVEETPAAAARLEPALDKAAE